MTWQGILGHDEVAERFRLALTRRRLASSFLFVGPSGIGKFTFALRFAQTLLCSESDPSAMSPCGRCENCRQVELRTHPDLILVSRPADKAFLPLELLIGDKEHRMREGLCHDLGIKPFMGARKIAVIEDADYLNAEGANCLLKTLEEPPPRSVLILIGSSAAKQLPTIRSRCQIVRFNPLPEDALANLLVERGLAADARDAARLAAMSEGSLDHAAELAVPGIKTLEENLLAGLASPLPSAMRLSAAVLAFVEEAGKEASARRLRLAQVIRLVIGYYRRLTLENAMAGLCDNRAAACLERCLEALEQIDRNVHQTALVECWMDDLVFRP